ncbi:hypothetical protein C922_05083 [Plasmodium inui San Antonio 1]|uniref:Uncharacterized protein n=1 Tax=Plasmodium inui San Antonio 1 TaxID=1237626 RepID=W7AGX8_9APIC|nr:hypothetical protein C922_05083 [Plasmodium inui San Antonio 1]EUD64521.1 hypothetical protein C922_05083 [Plasmodium inui San Antonio 1]
MNKGIVHLTGIRGSKSPEDGAATNGASRSLEFVGTQYRKGNRLDQLKQAKYDKQLPPTTRKADRRTRKRKHQKAGEESRKGRKRRTYVGDGPRRKISRESTRLDPRRSAPQIVSSKKKGKERKEAKNKPEPKDRHSW